MKGFGEAQRGDVPEGTAEMMTPETDEAIIKVWHGWLRPRMPMAHSAAARIEATSP